MTTEDNTSGIFCSVSSALFEIASEATTSILQTILLSIHILHESKLTVQQIIQLAPNVVSFSRASVLGSAAT